MRTSLLLLAAAVAVPSGHAEAQSWDAFKSFRNFCVMGSLNACGSVIVKTRSIAGGTEILMLVRNEEGSSRNSVIPAASYITAVGLTAPALDDLANFAIAIVGSVEETDNSPLGDSPPQSLWDFANGGMGGRVEFKAGTTGTEGRDGGIKGCGQPDDVAIAFFTTCDAQGFTGWVAFSFTTTTIDLDLYIDDFEIAMKFQALGDDGELSLVCRSGPPDPEDDSHVCVPEPSTWGLLLTGMVGVLGMGWLRRKRQCVGEGRILQ